MKIRLLLFLLLFLAHSALVAQTSPSLKALRGVSVAGGAGVKTSGNSKVQKEVLPLTSKSQATQEAIAVVYEELRSKMPASSLVGNTLSGGKITPGVYRIKGNAHLQKSLELVSGQQPNGIFIFQVEGDLVVDPAVKVELRQGVRAKNVFWQVAGKVQIGAGGSLKGVVVAKGNIEASKGATVQGKLLSQEGSVSLVGAEVSEVRTEHVSDLEVKHVVSEGPYGVGLIVTYTITLKNLGPDEETNVVMNFETPSGISFLSAVTSLGYIFDPLRRELVIDRFPSGAEVTMVAKASILKTEFSTTVVTVTGDGTDPNIKNNTSELSICATPSKLGDIKGKTSLCVNTTGNVYQVDPVVGARKYAWTLPAGWTITGGHDSNVIKVTTGGAEANGTISVRPVNACGEGPASTLDVSTVSSPPPMPSAVSGPPQACLLQQKIVYSINPVAGATSYVWELPLGWTVEEGHGTAAITVNAGITGGTVKVTAENACGKSASSSIEVTLAPAAPQKPASITGSNQVCANAEGIKYQVAAVPFATSYNWAVPDGWSITGGLGTREITVKAGVAAGQITVTAQNSCGVSGVTTLAVSTSSGIPVLGKISGEEAVCWSNAARTYSVESIEGVSSYQWTVPADWQILSDNGSRRINVKVGSSGEIKLLASNACGEGAVATLKVTVNTKLPATPGPISGAKEPCFNQKEVVYSVAPVSGAVSYHWTLPEGWSIIDGRGAASIKVQTGPAAGTISVVASNGCGNSPVRTLQVMPATAPPAAPVGIIGEVAPCMEGQQKYSVKNPVPGITYTWSVPAGWSIISEQGGASLVVKVGREAGVVKVTASNACGQSASTEVQVSPSNEVPALAPAIQGSASVCANADQLIYRIASTNAASSFLWKVPSGWTILNENGSSEIRVKAGTANGTIQVTAKNGCGQSITRSLYVAVSSAVPAKPGKITGNTNFCANAGETSFSIAEVNGATTYTWSLPEGWEFVRGQGKTTVVVRVGAVAGQVQVTASNACGTSAAVAANVNISEAAPKPFSFTAGDRELCVSSSSHTYSIKASEGATDYVWSVPAGWSFLSSQGGTSITVKPGASGGYVKVKASNACGSRSDSVNVVITQPLAASPGAIKGITTPCLTESSISYYVDEVPGATAYTWIVPTGWSIIGRRDTKEIKVKAGAGAGTITVVAMNACGASATVKREVIPQSPPVLPAGIIGETLPCGGGTEKNYSVRNPVPGTVYTWAVPNGWEIVSDQGKPEVTVKVGNEAGTVSVVASNSCGTSAAQVVMVVPTAVVPATDAINGSAAICTSALQTYSVAARADITKYHWEVPDGWIIEGGRGTREIQVRPGLQSGEVSVTSYYSCGTGYKRTLAVAVGTHSLAAPAAIKGESGVCAEQKQIVYSIEPVAGATSYDWDVPAGWTIVSGRGSVSITVQVGNTGGQVTVAARNTCGTSAITVKNVSISTGVKPVLGNIQSPAAACATTLLTYSVAAVDGVNTYNWTLPDGWMIKEGRGTRSITVIAGTAGGTLRVVGINGCGVSSDPRTLQVQVQPVTLAKPEAITTSFTAAPCVGQKGLSFKIDAVAGATSYEWSFPADWKLEKGQGSTTLFLTAGSSPGEVSVIAKNACGQSEKRIIAVIPANGAPTISGDIIGESDVCVSAGAVTYSITGVSGAESYFWSVPAGWKLITDHTSKEITVIPANISGTITVKAVSSCGLSTEKSLNVTASAIGQLKPGSITGLASFCASSELREFKIAAVPGATTYNWTVPDGWIIKEGRGTENIKVIALAGRGIVTVTAANACSAGETSSLEVSVAPSVGTVPVIKDESSTCVGNQFSVPAVPGATYTWSIITDEPGWTIKEGPGSNYVSVQAPANAQRNSAKISVKISNGVCSTTSASLDIEPKYFAPEIKAPNVFSPNNDGKNDLWVVRNLLEYPDNDVVILNRWGSEVYRMKNYRNNWNGGGLAEGTYFYVLRVRLCDNQEVVEKGYVTIMR
ncbi:DUF3494 domain-containing protein [Rufibacter immobilis]|uniref:DUF3494 domain-containing protein n=1 Tax=Rufibacter immobilis TaxID=1348778 RepID=A0A3M9N643_9BACT|nr:DUF3494 domain-containing protein [Rufibacter immobilis]